MNFPYNKNFVAQKLSEWENFKDCPLCTAYWCPSFMITLWAPVFGVPVGQFWGLLRFLGVWNCSTQHGQVVRLDACAKYMLTLQWINPAHNSCHVCAVETKGYESMKSVCSAGLMLKDFHQKMQNRKGPWVDFTAGCHLPSVKSQASKHKGSKIPDIKKRRVHIWNYSFSKLKIFLQNAVSDQVVRLNACACACYLLVQKPVFSSLCL